MKRRLEPMTSSESRQLLAIADTLVRKSVWIVGGDGWGYDIGFGGLDHVLASGATSKFCCSTPKFTQTPVANAPSRRRRAPWRNLRRAGKRVPKKDLGRIAMGYGTVYVASVAMGAKDEHTLKAFLEAEAYEGPALIIAYSHCIAHGINMTTGMQNQKAAVQCRSMAPLPIPS